MTSGTSEPSDGLGDGTATTDTVILLDVTTLSYKEAADYRRELIIAICHPGTDYDMVGEQKDIDEAAYKEQLLKVEEHLRSFGDAFLCPFT